MKVNWERNRNFRHLSHCENCGLRRKICICDQIHSLDCLHQISLVVHEHEKVKTTGTANLVTLAIKNATINWRYFGLKTDNSQESVPLLSGYKPLILFPSEDAIPLSQAWKQGEKVQFIVPDGTWRQASRIRRKTRGLEGIQAIRLDGEGIGQSHYHLRKEEKSENFSTAEAIISVLRLLGERDLAENLLHVFRLYVDRLLWTRGVLENDKVYGGGLPAEYRHHEVF